MNRALLTNRFLVACIAILTVNTSVGQVLDDYRTRASGNWNATSTWQRYDGTDWVNINGVSPNTIPNSGDKSITIRASHTVTVTANATADQVTIESGAQVTVNSGKTLTVANGTGTDMIVYGTISNDGTIAVSGSINFGANAVYYQEKNGGTIPTATWDITSSCIVTGITSSAPNGLDQDFGNFTWNCTSQSSNINLTGDLKTVLGNFKVQSTGSGGDVLRLTNATDLTFGVGGDFILTGGDLVFTDNKADVTINVAGNFSQSGGSIDMSTDNQIGVLVLNVNGNLSQTAGDFDFTSGSANTARKPAINLAGDFMQSGSATMSTSTTDTDITNGTITFTKNGPQAFSVATQSHITYTNFVVNAGSVFQLNSNLTLSSNSTDTWAGNLTIKANATFDAGTYQLLSSTGSGGGDENDFTLSAGATIITANGYGLRSGNNGTISSSIANYSFSSAANYIFNGSANQNSGVFTTTPTANQVNDLTINNTGGGTGLSLQQPFSVAGTCYFTAGLITSTATNLLTFKDNAVASGANNNVTNPSYVNGPVKKIGNDAFTFPVGKQGVGYMRCAISAPSFTTDAFTAEYMRSSGAGLGSISAAGLYRVSACEYWNIDRTTGSSAVNVTLSWSGISPCSGAAYVNSLSALVVAHFNGSQWNAFGNNGGTTGNGASGTVTWNNVSSFSPFTLGSNSAITNPLPVKFSDVKAFPVTNGNQIGWTNLTEENLVQYMVERSADGHNFNTIFNVEPASNDGQSRHYTLTDEQAPAGTSFYRIKALQTDGSYLYSAIVKVTTGAGTGTSIIVYPNPVVSDQFALQLNNYPKGAYQLKFISGNGQEVFNRIVQHPGGSATISLERPSTTRPGLYILQINGKSVNENRKLMVQ